MDKGFYISKLEVRGIGKKTAELKFNTGFNLISGGSDTGKSFAFSCLEFMLGREKSPKSIPEAAGYTEIYLQINKYTGEPSTLSRKINGGDYLVKECVIGDFMDSKIPYKPLSVNVQTKDNISDFLLTKCGFQLPIQIKKNQKNVTRKLTFNTLRHLTFVNEVTILNETSPFYNAGSYTDYTYYKYLVNFLLSGSSGEGLTKITDDNLRKSWTNGKIDFVTSQITHISDKLIELEKEEFSYTTRQPKISIEEVKKKLDTVNMLLDEFSKEKEKNFHQLEKEKSQQIYQNEIIERLNLLRKHYLSDKERLSFIAEGETFLNQLNTVDCPLCNSELDENQQSRILENVDIKRSVVIEAEKISLKLTDLDKTIMDVKSNAMQTKIQINNLTAEIADKNRMIQEVLNPNLDSLMTYISNFEGLSKIQVNIEIYKNELDYYRKEKGGLENDMKLKPKAGETSQSFGSILKLMPIIERILESWNYGSDIDVQFDNSHKIFDIIISGKPRSSFGKGMRSISYTAVIISILKYCASNNKPFSNLLIFDSPLTAYQKGDAKNTKEEISQDIQNEFFKSMALLEKDRQIIVFDNKFPEEKIANKINFEYFTKSKTHGRYGFLPL